MSPVAFTELTNEIFDISHETSAVLHAEEGNMGGLMLGVFIALLPRIIPRMLPTIVGGVSGYEDTAKLEERYGSDEYASKLEHRFRETMLQNLEMTESLVLAWRDNKGIDEILRAGGLDFLAGGSGGIFSRKDEYSGQQEDGGELVVGSADYFQTELLRAIEYLRGRLQVAQDPANPDHVTKIANRMWDTAETVAQLIAAYLQI